MRAYIFSENPVVYCIVLSAYLPIAKADNLTLSDWRYIYKNIDVFEEKSSGGLLGLINPKVTVNVPTDVELGGWWRVATFFYHRQNRDIHMIGHCGTMPLGFASGSVQEPWFTTITEPGNGSLVLPYNDFRKRTLPE